MTKHNQHYKNFDKNPISTQANSGLFDGSGNVNFSAAMYNPRPHEIDSMHSLYAGVYTDGSTAFLVLATNCLTFSAKINTKEINHALVPYGHNTTITFSITESKDGGNTSTAKYQLNQTVIDQLNQVIKNQRNVDGDSISQANKNKEMDLTVESMAKATRMQMLEVPETITTKHSSSKAKFTTEPSSKVCICDCKIIKVVQINNKPSRALVINGKIIVKHTHDADQSDIIAFNTLCESITSALNVKADMIEYKPEETDWDWKQVLNSMSALSTAKIKNI